MSASTSPPPAARAGLARPAVPAAIGLLTAALLVAGLPIAAAAHQFGGTGVIDLVIMLPFAAVGAVVASLQPQNPIGWMLLAVAFANALSVVTGMEAVLVYNLGHTGLPLPRLAVALAPIGWIAMLVLLPLCFFLFPDGHLPTRRWRWAVYGYLAVWSVVLGAIAVTETGAFRDRHIRIDGTGELAVMGNSPGWLGAITGAAIPEYAIFCLLFVIAQVRVYRRTAGERRQQLKWLVAGGTLCVAGLSLQLVLGSSSDPITKVVVAGGFLGVVALPLTIGIGILKYRLYDVDRLISRTLSYTLLTAALLAIFSGIVLVTTRVLPFSSPVGVAASTLAAAALFTPLRRRLQRLVDRRFNRARYDAEAIVAGFSSSLRGAVDLEAVQAELLSAVDRAIEPAQASVWLRQA